MEESLYRERLAMASTMDSVLFPVMTMAMESKSLADELTGRNIASAVRSAGDAEWPMRNPAMESLERSASGVGSSPLRTTTMMP